MSNLDVRFAHVLLAVLEVFAELLDMKSGPVGLRPHEHESRLEDLIRKPAVMLSHALP